MKTTDRLTALDVAFLHAEGPDTPLHVGAIVVLEGGPLVDASGHVRIDDIRSALADRLDALPRFRQVPRSSLLGRAVWADAPDFDVAHHVKVTTLPAPGDEAQLLARCEELEMEVLDRSRPLWELWFIEGLSGGRVAIMEKIHHAMVDGVSGVEVAAVLMDLTPEPRQFEPSQWEPQPLAGWLLAARALADAVRGPLGMGRAALGAARHPSRLVTTAGETARVVRALVERHPTAPHSSLNDRRVHRHRRLGLVRWELAEVKHVAHSLDATVNDVVLAAVTGGLRALLLERRDLPRGLRLRALVPVSRRADHERLALGNRVAALLVPLPVAEPDPAARLAAIRTAVRERQARGQPDAAEALLGVSEHLPEPLVAWTSRLVHHQPLVNLVVTNVPGPPVPLYVMGARVLELLPIVPLAGNLSVGVAVLSYDGRLTIGVHADPDCCPDLDDLVAGIEESFRELGALAPAPAGAPQSPSLLTAGEVRSTPASCS